MIVWRKSSRSGTNDDSACIEVAGLWRQSSRSGSHEGDGECMEVAGPGGSAERVIGVRDSKDPDGPKLWLSPAAWTTFAESIKSGTV